MYFLKGVVIVIFILIKWVKNVIERVKVIWYCICLKVWNWVCEICMCVIFKFVNLLYWFVIFEDYLIYLKYNGV